MGLSFTQTRLPRSLVAPMRCQTIGYVIALALLIFAPLCLAQDSPPPEVSPLAGGQKDVAGRFSRLENLLLRSAELEAGENPTRAALLQQAVQLSKQAQLGDLLANAATNLEQNQFSEAIEKQKAGRENLKRLLELLQSENREERVREKRDQVRRWIEETDRLLRLQSSLRGRTEGGQDSQQAAGDQNKLANKADEIASDLKGNSPDNKDEAEPDASGKEPESTSSDTNPPGENGDPLSEKDNSDNQQPTDDVPQQDPKDGPPNEEDPANAEEQGKSEQGKSEQGKSEQGKSEQGKSEQGKSEQGKSEQGKSEQGKSEQGKSEQGQQQQGQQQQGQQQQGQQQQGQQQQGQQQPSKNQQPQDPTERAQQKIEQAQERMKEAQEQLEQAEREGAVEKQLEAENNLREAIEELEEILRQLREEEIERSLASLETRLRRMLEMQTKVVEETKRLQEISGEQAVRQVEIRASSLARDERKILSEGERAFLLLREEGSSAAFPEAIEQVNTDIAKVAERLDAADVGALTVVIEEEIVISLEEMVEALVQVQKDNKEKEKQRQQGGQPQQGQPGDQPLVDKLAEIRLIRTLQIRINNRTEALSKMLDNPTDPIGQVEEGEVLQELRGLSERQASIQTVTRDIVVGKGE